MYLMIYSALFLIQSKNFADYASLGSSNLTLKVLRKCVDKLPITSRLLLDLKVSGKHWEFKVLKDSLWVIYFSMSGEDDLITRVNSASVRENLTIQLRAISNDERNWLSGMKFLLKGDCPLPGLYTYASGRRGNSIYFSSIRIRDGKYDLAFDSTKRLDIGKDGTFSIR